MKKIISIFMSIFLLSITNTSIASPILYTFEGVVTGFQSYHQDYDINNFDIIVGETTLRYVFEVDFSTDQSSFTNSTGTWDYFYSDLIEGSVINNGNISGESGGFNWYRLGDPNLGQVTGTNLGTVRITSSEMNTPNWQVQDWQIGQSFNSTDLACYAGGISGCAVYAFGDVTLTSITTVPLPSALILFVSGLFGLRLMSNKT